MWCCNIINVGSFYLFTSHKSRLFVDIYRFFLTDFMISKLVMQASNQIEWERVISYDIRGGIIKFFLVKICSSPFTFHT